MTHPHPKINFVPKAVLMKSSFKILNTASQNSSRAAVSVNTARPINTAYPRPTVNSARPVLNVFNRAHSHDRRPFNKFTTNKNSNFNEKVNTNKGNFTTAGPKAVVSDNKGNEANAVKASACWGNPQQDLEDKGVIDSGCSRHMTENRFYLTDSAGSKLYEDLVAFGAYGHDQFYEIKGIKREFSVAWDFTTKWSSRKETLDTNSGWPHKQDPNELFLVKTYLKLHETIWVSGYNPYYHRSPSLKDSLNARFKPSRGEEKKDVEDLGNKDCEVPSTKEPRVNQEKENDMILEERGGQCEKGATTAASLDVEQDSETQGSAPVATAGVSVSTAEPSTPPTTTTFIEDEDLTIAQTL
ncbi:hypothetical protein Tco_0260685 [Tanacetum coccineum]